MGSRKKRDGGEMGERRGKKKREGEGEGHREGKESKKFGGAGEKDNQKFCILFIKDQLLHNLVWDKGLSCQLSAAGWAHFIDLLRNYTSLNSSFCHQPSQNIYKTHSVFAIVCLGKCVYDLWVGHYILLMNAVNSELRRSMLADRGNMKSHYLFLRLSLYENVLLNRTYLGITYHIRDWLVVKLP